MGTPGEVDLENQQLVVSPVAIHSGGSLQSTSPFSPIFSACQRFIMIFTPKYRTETSPTAGDHETQEVEITKLVSASTNVSQEVSLNVEDDSTITSIASDDLVSEEMNSKVEVDTTRSTDIQAKTQHANISIIVKEKNLRTIQNFGGNEGIAEALGTDLRDGIPGDEQDLHDRRSGMQAPSPSFFKLLIRSCCDWTIFLLLICAILSIIFGIKQEGSENGWVEGAAILFAITILVSVPALRNYFSVPHTAASTSQVEVNVYRGGKLVSVHPPDVVPGDIVRLKSGSLVPADGLFVSTTGESLVLEDGLELPTIDDKNPFLVHGARVVSGNASMLVTCVGMETALGEQMERVRSTPKQAQLPAQLDKLSTILQIIGLLISIFMTLTLIIRSTVLKDDEYPGFQADQLKGKPIASEDLMVAVGKLFSKNSGQISVLATYLPLLIVGLVEGLPICYALAIFYWEKNTHSGKAIAPYARSPLACYTMGAVSTICIGGGLNLESLDHVPEVVVSCDGDEIIDAEKVSGVDKRVREALYKGINSPLLMPSSHISSTECQLLLSWAKSNLGNNEHSLQSCNIVENSIEKLSTTDEETCRVLMEDTETEEDTGWYQNGPATSVLAMCSEYYDREGNTKLMDEHKKHVFEEVMEKLQSKHFNTIAFAYNKMDAPGTMPEKDKNLILIGLLGMKCCTETMEAVKILRTAGVRIIQFPEDDASVLRGEMPIYEMGRPLDKLDTVQRLKDEGNVVAMIGARSNETPALKEADVGIVIETCTSEMAREVCDLIIHNGGFNFLVPQLVQIGRCIRGNIQKYIQVELIMNISLLANFSITTIFLGHTMFGAIHSLWATITVTVTSFPLLIEPPTEELMEKPPVKQTEPLISKTMWRNIVLQAMYQTTVLVYLQFRWKSLPGVNEKNMESIVFNSYVLCQVCNQVSSRAIEKKNVFRGIFRTPWLLVAISVSISLQVAFTEIAHKVAGNARLNLAQWGVCFLIGMVSLGIDLAGKYVSGIVMKIKQHFYPDIASLTVSIRSSTSTC